MPNNNDTGIVYIYHTGKFGNLSVVACSNHKRYIEKDAKVIYRKEPLQCYFCKHPEALKE